MAGPSLTLTRAAPTGALSGTFTGLPAGMLRSTRRIVESSDNARRGVLTRPNDAGYDATADSVGLAPPSLASVVVVMTNEAVRATGGVVTRTATVLIPLDGLPWMPAPLMTLDVAGGDGVVYGWSIVSVAPRVTLALCEVAA